MKVDDLLQILRRISLVGALLALSGTVYAQPAAKRESPPKTRPAAPASAAVEATIKRADAAREAGRLSEALELYARVLQARPKWSDGWWYVGTIMYDADRYAEARDALRNVVALEPKRGPAWGMLGLCEFQTREYERAVNSLQRSRTLGLGGNQEIENVVRYHTAILYARFQEFEVSFEILREFVRVGYESPKIIEAFGLSMLRLPFLPNEVPSEKREPLLIAGRAGFDMAAHRRDQARRAFDELLAKYPETPNVHYSFGVFLLGQDPDAAIEEFRRELKISPSHVPSMVQMAFEYFKRKDFEAALPLAEQSARLAPKMYPARNVLGRVLLELGEIEKATQELEEGVRLAPDSLEMHYALARAYTRGGRREDAAREREIFQRLEKLYQGQRNQPPATDETGEKSDPNQSKPKP
ncbi:MAG TPA: tetratricopeptide repeat protein [Blastocatellia bacterium]|nr:tetratricopeptide repeat protein [Blastocatellia bacterium]